MTLRYGWPRIALFAAAVAVVVVLMLELRTRHVEMQGLAQLQEENLLWSAAQLSIETARYAEAIGAFRLQRTEAAAARAVKRFDILWSRVALFTGGRTAMRLTELDSVRLIPAFDAFLHRHDAAGSDPASASDFELGLMVAELRALARALQGYMARALHREETRTNAIFAAINEANLIGGYRALGALCAGALMLAAALAQGRADRRRLVEQRRLTTQAEAAAAARGRFLTMMSHELRTPMNGVLGMLALARDRAEDARMRAALGVAQASAGEMIWMIEDILELADIEAGNLPRQAPPMRLGAVGEAVLGALSRRRPGIGWTLCLDDAAPEATARIDVACLAGAATQAALFFMDRLGARRLTLTVALRGGEVAMTIGAADGSARGWDPAAFLGPLTDAGAAIQTDAIGPAIAKGLVRHLGGRGFVHRRPDGGAVVTIVAPTTGPVADDPQAAALAAEAARDAATPLARRA